MKVVYQQPESLVLGISMHEIDYPVNVLEKRSVERDSWRFTFHIIGESHLVSVERKAIPVWQEILACVSLRVDRLIHHHCFQQLQNHAWECKDYAIAVSFSQQEPRELKIGEQMKVIFPEVYGQVPYTSIQWLTTHDSVRWQTVHMYPNEDGSANYVCSESIFYVD